MKKYIYTNNNRRNYKFLKIWWLKWFMPKMYLKKFDELPISLLKKLSIKIVVCDIDNTIVPYYKNVPNFNSIKFVKNIQDNGIKFIVVSNNIKSRVVKFAKKLNVDDCYWFAKKPFPSSLKKISKKYNVKRSEILVMGDQVLTDIFMANIYGSPSVLVLPLLNEDHSSLKIVSYINDFLYKRLTSNSLINFTNIYTDNEKNKNINDWL